MVSCGSYFIPRYFLERRVFYTVSRCRHFCIGYVRIVGCRVLVMETVDTCVSFFRFVRAVYVIFFRGTNFGVRMLLFEFCRFRVGDTESAAMFSRVARASRDARGFRFSVVTIQTRLVLVSVAC